MPRTPLHPEQHFDRFQQWLDMEGAAERERLEERRKVQSSAQAEKSGDTLLDLVIRSHGTGLGGRYLLTLQKRRSPDRLPWHRFRVGSPVILSGDGSAAGEMRPMQGVVSGRRQDCVEVAVNDWPEADRMRLDLSPDEVTRKRQIAAMDSARQATGRTAQLRDLLLYEREPTFDERPQKPPEKPSSLNESQEAAVQFALSANDLAIVHGPPGTGKTEFAKTIASHLGLTLYSVGEEDEDGDEPTRRERLASLRLAQTLLQDQDDCLVLFDEMDDLFESNCHSCLE